jgi:hypothetical protein
MANSGTTAFHAHFGVSPPAALVTLLGDDGLREITPVEFCFAHVAFGLQVQCWLDITDATHFDVANQRVAFAVTTDGFTIYASLANKALNIIQDEFGDSDYIGITIYDLLAAERRQLP